MTAPASTLGQLARLLTDPGAVLALSVTLVFFAGQFVVITFLGPVVTAASGTSASGLALYLWLFGVAAVVANLMGGFMADRFGPASTIAGLIIGSALVVAVLTHLQAQPVAAGLTLILWGLTGYAFMTPQQSRLVALLPWAPGLALSLNASGLYAGSAIGGAIGSVIVDRTGLQPLGPGAAVLLVVALLLLVWSGRVRPGTGSLRA
jgi:predicted MFS family arabinose efflux permease